MKFEILVILVLNLFPLSEIMHAIKKRANSSTASIDDQGSLKNIWIVILLAITMASIAKFAVRLPLAIHSLNVEAASVLFLLAGMTLRWTSIVILGRHFTVNVAIIKDHVLIKKGPYRWIRHPSYTGLLVSFAGVGIYFNNLVSLIVLMLPIIWVVAKRIKIEESALSKVFGTSYSEYCRSSKRLLPYIW